MALRFSEKQERVTKMNSFINQSVSVVLANYRGLSVKDVTDLRMLAKKNAVSINIVRNSLAVLAVKDTPFACMEEYFKGPVLMASSTEDLSAPVKLLYNFAKANMSLQIVALSFGDKLWELDNIQKATKLPTKDEAIAQLMSLMQAPVRNLVCALNDIPTRLVRVLAQRAEQIS